MRKGPPYFPRLWYLPVDVLKESLEETCVRVNDDEVARLAGSIAEYGVVQPIVVSPKDGRLVVVAGAERLLAVQRLGWTEVMCVVEGSFEDIVRVGIPGRLARPMDIARCLKAREEQLLHELGRCRRSRNKAGGVERGRQTGASMDPC